MSNTHPEGNGGGINNKGTLTATNCTISDNSTTSVTLGGKGGGIYNDGTLTLTNSTLADNLSDSNGGGIDNDSTGTVTVADCTLSGNSADAEGLSSLGNGGGIENGGTLTLTNSTLADNEAGTSGGGICNTQIMMVAASTLSNNNAAAGGGAANTGTLALTISLFDNRVGGNLVLGSNAKFTSQGYNLFSDDPAVPLGPTDLINSDPLLGPLAGNGGPTQTCALLPGSPAIDAGVAVAGVTTDQRGVPRTQGAVPDIGAFESRGFTVAIVSGNDQVAPTLAAAPAPLVVAVTSPYGEPVAGGRLTFAAPTTGASADLTPNPVTIGSDGRASVAAVANGSVGTYTVTARAAGASPVAFALTNFAIPPMVVGLQATGQQAPRTAIVLTFSEPMDAARAQNPANYRLVWTGPDDRLETRDDRVIGIRTARYDRASEAVTLQLAQAQPLHRTSWLTFASRASGGLTNVRGTALAGPGTAGAGGGNAIRLDLASLVTPMRLGLLPDGGFETPRTLGRNKALTLSAGGRPLGSWQGTAGSVNVQRYWPAPERRQTLDLNGISPGTIEQSFATIPGQFYQLLFDYGDNPDDHGRTATATVTVTGAGPLLNEGIAHAGSKPRDMKYTRFLEAFVADSTVTTLRFASTTPGAYGIVLDAVSVTEVPGAPNEAALLPL